MIQLSRKRNQQRMCKIKSWPRLDRWSLSQKLSCVDLHLEVKEAKWKQEFSKQVLLVKPKNVTDEVNQWDICRVL